MSTQQPNDPIIEITRSILSEAAQRPWLAALLLRRKPDWLTRLAQWAQRVRDLPLHTRRKLTSGLAAAALLLALAGTPTAYAAGITVTPGAAGKLTDGKCSLAEAIINANDDAATWPDCAAGSGADIITLPANATLSYATALSGDGYSALPDITSQITIEANGSTIERTDGSPNFRILNIASTGDLTLNQATISGGNAVNGGGIYNYGPLTVTSSTISNNTANGGLGGGIFNGSNSGTLTVTSSTISNNTANTLGGGIFNFGTATVSDSTISNNTATSSGGGIFNDYRGTATVSNSTVSGNTSAFGGGGIENGGPLTVTNSTLSGNTSSSGGGIDTDGSTAVTTVQNSIVALQSSGVDCVTANGGTITSQGYNIESAASCGFTGTGDLQSQTSGALNLQALAQNGSKPHPFTRALGTSPTFISVAKDRIPIGTNGCAATNTDERGAQRAGGGTHGGTACDVGAYEVSDQTPTAVTLRNLTATGNASPGVIGAVGATLAALGALVVGRRRLKVR